MPFIYSYQQNARPNIRTCQDTALDDSTVFNMAAQISRYLETYRATSII